MALLRDMTERRSAEELRLQLERTERLASVGQLAASVAHEINNPLAYVITNLELLMREVRRRSGEDPTAAEKYVPRIQYALEGAQRVARIVSDLGTFSRKEPVNLAQPTDLTEAVESALAMASTQLKHRALVHSELSELPPVRGDSGRLCQVFLNVFVNAAHAMSEGPVRDNSLDVRSFTEGDMAIVEVRDTGVGIPGDVQDRAFEPFFTTKKAGEGSGLGLYVCKNIMHSFGGSIELSNNADRGALVRVRVPLWRRSEAPKNSAKPASLRHGARQRVLIVDDEQFLLRSLGDVLSDQHDVVLCTSGAEAQGKLSSDDAFDMILCDVVMPNGTGPELLSWLREHKPRLAERIVFMTGGGVGALRSLPSDGSVRIMTKPFAVEDVLAQIEAVTQADEAKRTRHS
jgi:nitrogen-specific signal transduction histidine kinase/CheY-like chemotaxis protein